MDRIITAAGVLVLGYLALAALAALTLAGLAYARPHILTEPVEDWRVSDAEGWVAVAALFVLAPMLRLIGR